MKHSLLLLSISLVTQLMTLQNQRLDLLSMEFLLQKVYSMQIPITC